VRVVVRKGGCHGLVVRSEWLAPTMLLLVEDAVVELLRPLNPQPERSRQRWLATGVN